MLSNERIAEIKRRKDAATPGPWKWFGNTDNCSIYLATVNRGRIFIMDFVRWGFRGAQPRFQVHHDGHGIMTDASELVRFEVATDVTGVKAAKANNAVYRRDVQDIAHADADFLANAISDVSDLLDEREERQWVSVKDRLPEDNDMVILFCRLGICGQMTFGVHHEGKWLDYNCTTDDYPNDADNVTHWMSLPVAPEVK